MVSKQHCVYVLPEDLREDHAHPTASRCRESGVTERVTSGNFCIFHRYDSGFNETELQMFNDALRSKSDSNYRGFKFPPGFHTKNLRLEKADFTGAHFFHNADFSGKTFEGSTYFSGVTFEKRANFKEATFHGNVSFGGATFKEDANFENTSFLQRKPGMPSHQELMDSAMGTVNFNKARFEALADFTNSKFKVTSSFIHTSFLGDAVFIATKFCECANVKFSFTTFSKDCDFIEARSRSRIDFYRCVFTEEAVFRNAVLQGPTEFHGSVFGHRATFGDDPGRQSEEKRLRVRFVNMDMVNVAFRGADLREASFWHCANLDRAELSSCRWNNAFDRQRVLYDELALRRCKPKWGSWGDNTNVTDTLSYEDWERAESTYRDLRRNFEDRRDYAGASEFYVGEMEMRRLTKPRLERNILSLEALYFSLSTYGESWRKPLVWLLILLLLSSSVYALSGLELAVSKPPLRISWPPGTASFTNDVGVFGLAFIHSLSVLTFLRVSVAEPAHWIGQIMAILQLLLSPILVTLSLLAIRRKLKR